jgi:hypothetical protein
MAAQPDDDDHRAMIMGDIARKFGWITGGVAFPAKWAPTDDIRAAYFRRDDDDSLFEVRVDSPLGRLILTDAEFEKSVGAADFTDPDTETGIPRGMVVSARVLLSAAEKAAALYMHKTTEDAVQSIKVTYESIKAHYDALAARVAAAEAAAAAAAAEAEAAQP